MDEGKTPFAGWAILEVFGHTRLVGFVSEVDIFGSKMARIEIPAHGALPAETRYYGASALFSVTETTEEKVHAELEQLARYLAPRERLLLDKAVRVEEDGLGDDWDDEREEGAV